jgi:CheY-like chemotaxis protein
MEWSTVVFVLGLVAILAVIVVGGRAKVGKGGIEIDTGGIREWLRKAQEEKKAPAGQASRNKTPPAEAQELARAPAPSTKVPRARVLWVDDHPLNNIFERQALASAGIFADSYTTNEDAEQALDRVPYDLVISDIARDGRGELGWDLLDVVRRNRPATPFLFYVGSAGPERRAEAERRGASGMTADPGELMRLIAGALPARRKSAGA